MTEPTRVQFEYLPPIKVYIPGPLASRAGNALRDMQQTITATLQAMRHSAESDHDVIALEVIAERLHEVTRKVRRAERAHVAAWTAEVQARDMGMTTKEPPDETSPELEP
jgi:hypothetical protein